MGNKIMTGNKGNKKRGRPSAEESGIEKKAMVPAYLRKAQKDWLVKKYGSITAALESLLPQRLRNEKQI
jgi:hypothetical protein